MTINKAQLTDIYMQFRCGNSIRENVHILADLLNKEYMDSFFSKHLPTEQKPYGLRATNPNSLCNFNRQLLS